MLPKLASWLAPVALLASIVAFGLISTRDVVIEGEVRVVVDDVPGAPAGASRQFGVVTGSCGTVFAVGSGDPDAQFFAPLAVDAAGPDAQSEVSAIPGWEDAERYADPGAAIEAVCRDAAQPQIRLVALCGMLASLSLAAWVWSAWFRRRQQAGQDSVEAGGATARVRGWDDEPDGPPASPAGDRPSA